MEAESGEHLLALVIDPDPGSRRAIRKMLAASGFEAVHAPNGLVGLELIQRLPDSFRLLLVDLELPGIPGAVVMETLRLFRPDLPVLCMATAAVGAAVTAAGCLSKPVDPAELRTQIDAALAGAAPRWEPAGGATAAEAVLRARACYDQGKSLVDAALELARGYRGE
jgi:DNA-binding response OmpR family regulator